MALSSDPEPCRWRFASTEVDERGRELRVDGQVVELEPKPFDVLILLLRHAGDLVTPDEMLEQVWTGRIVNEATIANTVFKVRKALGDEHQSIIRTVPKAGYRLVAPVERLSAPPAVPAGPDLAPGTAVPGREQWQLAERLGSGGYGEAWLARHEKSGEQRVFKFCRDVARLPALKREVTLYRLLRQSLGDRHPFVRILEWNFEQAPYFIESEYAGDNLRSWAERRGGLLSIPLQERCERIAEAATAIALAHSVGVLHKDLKPENVLIIDSESGGLLRLCDFGVGEVIQAERLAELGITRLGMSHTIAADSRSTQGTLLYLAPERLSGLVASAQSDIYALGVMLFQIVIGDFSRPMAHGWESGIDDELLRQDIADATYGDPDKRLASARTLAERLRALPQRRIEVAQRREEQARWSAAQAAVERARLRRPWLITAVAALLTGLAISSYAWLRVRSEARIAEQFNQFITNDVLHAADRYHSELPEISLRSTVLKSLPLLPQRFAGSPIVEAEMAQTLARVLNRLADPRDALPLNQRVLQINVQQYGPDDPRALMAQIDLAWNLSNVGRDDEALRTFDAAFPKLAAALKPNDPAVLFARYVGSGIECVRAECPAGLKAYAQLIADIRATHANDDLRVASEYEYVRIMIASGDLDGAEHYLRTMVPEIVTAYGDGSRQALLFRGQLGKLLLIRHRLSEAESVLRSSVEGLITLLGTDHAETIDHQLLLAQVLGLEGHWQASLEQLQAAYAARVRTEGLRQANLVPGWAIAQSLDALGRHEEALSWAQQSAAIAAHDLPEVDDNALAARFFVAKALIHLHREVEAGAIVEAILPLAAKQHSGDFLWQWNLLELQAELAKANRNFPQAREFARRALDSLEQRYGPEDPTTARIRALLDSLPSSSS